MAAKDGGAGVLLGVRRCQTIEPGRVSLLFDRNLSRRLPALLAAKFPGSEQVIGAGLATADDRAVWAYAAARGQPASWPGGPRSP